MCSGAQHQLIQAMAQPDRALQRGLEALLALHLKERSRLLLAAHDEVLLQLQEARSQILVALIALPADWKQLQLQAVLTQLDAILSGATSRAIAPLGVHMQLAWAAGESMVDAAVSHLRNAQRLETVLPMLDVQVLRQMRAFADLRLRDVGTEALTKIGRQLGLALLGAQTPHETIKSIQQLLEAETPNRAATIVQTSLNQAWATANQERLAQAAVVLPGLGKQWRRSGKIHSRWNHDIMDGEVVSGSERFKVPNPSGGFDMMTGPHDPTAPVEQLIHCGCIALPWMQHWKVKTPGAKPFTEREKTLDPRKAALDQATKRAGRRKE